jgi:predicted ATPase
VGVASAVAQLADRHPAAGLLAWARRLNSNIPGWSAVSDERNATKYYAENQEKSITLMGVIQQLDTGIMGMTLSDTANGLQPEFIHQGLGRNLTLASESEGTRQYYRIHPIIWEALEHVGIAIVDEMDSAIHPMILPSILRWFHDRTINAGDAQLWMSGHSASLLEDLKKEEVYFAEKDWQGRTRVYGLKDIEGVRRVDNFYQKYLGGVYGAVPRIG